jgi:hypothetical protein
MIGMPTYNNLKVLVDVFPFQKDKRWHVTAGFFLGPSRIAKAYNATEAMPTLLAVGIYNTMREKTLASYAEGWPYPPIISVGPWELNETDLIEKLADRFIRYGRMGMHVGDFDDGTPYMMEPGDDGMVRAEVKTNAFKPYLGLGYGGRLLKNNDKFHVAVDLGAMFWGGSPSIITHEGEEVDVVSKAREKINDARENYSNVADGIKEKGSDAISKIKEKADSVISRTAPGEDEPFEEDYFNFDDEYPDPEEVKEKVEEKAGEAAEIADEAVEKVEDAVKDAAEKAEELSEAVEEKAEELAEDAEDKFKSTINDFKARRDRFFK